MSYRNREREIKLLVRGITKLPRGITGLDAVNAQLFHLFPKKIRSIHATSEDTYWALPTSAEGDFIRARDHDSLGSWEITVKAEDRGSSFDRLETEINTENDPRRMLRACFGMPTGTVTKTYHTHWVGAPVTSYHKETTICCYVVEGHPELGVVVEAESPLAMDVRDLEGKIGKILIENRGWEVENAPGSLYTMLFNTKKGEV